MSLVQQFNAYSRWRGGLGSSIARLRQWLSENGLGDAQTDLRLRQMLEKLREDRLVVAFVAEFSRGKSELINAIFFAEYGSRILPSSAGRTTMCPTELLYDPADEPSISLLPIETRARATTVADLKRTPEEWRRQPLDTSSAEAMSEAMRRVGEQKYVSAIAAQDLGFTIDVAGERGLQFDDLGRVQVPCWRHAIINFPHPLLEQGLVILDTPGLNAIGAEPELTLALLPSAHAVLFILAADTGVTQSDLVVWRDHVSAAGQNKGRLAVLNKIDGLWDGLRPAGEIDAEIGNQVATSARILGLPAEQVYPVSAQKGLVAKINGDEDMLEKSCLPVLERALADELLPAKQQIVTESIAAEAQDLVAAADALLGTRLAGLREQLAELTDLRGKNQSVIHYMMRKVKSEKDEFEKGLQQYYAVRSVLSQLTNNLFAHLGMEALREHTRKTREAMRDAAFSKGLSDAMSGLFRAVRDNLARSDKEIGEITKMMEAMYLRFATEHGMKLDSPRPFILARHEKEIDRLEESFKRQFGGILIILTREKRVLTQQFFETVAVQVRKTFEKANRDVEHWLRAIMAPIESQVREVQLQLKRRLESVKRIHEATDTLEDRIAELEHGQQLIAGQRSELAEFAAEMGRGDKTADTLPLATAA